jgi:hypothetical protein
MVTFRNDSEGEPVTSRFVFARVHAAHGWRDDQRWTGWREDSEVPPREEWLIAEWPEGELVEVDWLLAGLAAAGPALEHWLEREDCLREGQAGRG